MCFCDPGPDDGCQKDCLSDLEYRRCCGYEGVINIYDPKTGISSDWDCRWARLSISRLLGNNYPIDFGSSLGFSNVVVSRFPNSATLEFPIWIDPEAPAAIGAGGGSVPIFLGSKRDEVVQAVGYTGWNTECEGSFDAGAGELWDLVGKKCCSGTFCDGSTVKYFGQGNIPGFCLTNTCYCQECIDNCEGDVNYVYNYDYHEKQGDFQFTGAVVYADPLNIFENNGRCGPWVKVDLVAQTADFEEIARYTMQARGQYCIKDGPECLNPEGCVNKCPRDATWISDTDFASQGDIWQEGTCRGDCEEILDYDGYPLTCSCTKGYTSVAGAYEWKHYPCDEGGGCPEYSFATCNDSYGPPCYLGQCTPCGERIAGSHFSVYFDA